MTPSKRLALIVGRIEGTLQASGQIDYRDERCVMVPLTEAQQWIDELHAIVVSA